MSVKVAEEWFAKILLMKDGEKTIIPVQDKRIRTKLMKELKDLKDAYSLIDPGAASKIEITPDFKDRNWFVVVTSTVVTSLVGIHVDINGVPSEISIKRDVGDRFIMLMIKDKLSIEEIETNLGRKLTEEERRKYFGEDTGTQS
jgi:hypothetical protein